MFKKLNEFIVKSQLVLELCIESFIYYSIILYLLPRSYSLSISFIDYITMRWVGNAYLQKYMKAGFIVVAFLGFVRQFR